MDFPRALLKVLPSVNAVRRIRGRCRPSFIGQSRRTPTLTASPQGAVSDCRVAGLDRIRDGERGHEIRFDQSHAGFSALPSAAIRSQRDATRRTEVDCLIVGSPARGAVLTDRRRSLPAHCRFPLPTVHSDKADGRALEVAPPEEHHKPRHDLATSTIAGRCNPSRLPVEERSRENCEKGVNPRAAPQRGRSMEWTG